MGERRGRRRSLIHGYGAARRASWLELFFDLVFVVAVFRLGQLLLDDPSARGVLVFAGLMSTIWWLWFSFSYFADLFDDDRPPSRIVQLAAMLGVLALSASLPHWSAGDADRFAVAYGLLLALLTATYGIVGRIDVEAREFCWWNAAGFLIGAVLWFGSLLVSVPARYWVWGVALVVNAAIAGPLAYAVVRRAPTQKSHMPERFGLFTIVVLGDAVLAVANGIGATGWRPAAVAIGVGGFIMASGVWWVYFLATYDSEAGNRVLRAGREAVVRSYFYAYGHLLVYAAIVTAGVAVELAAKEAAHPGPGHDVAGRLLGGSQLAMMAGCVIIYRGISLSVSRPVALTQSGLALVALVIALAGLPPVVAVSLSAIAWVLLAVVEQRSASDRPR
ncbi:low temperature requirement protein A [Micromonospora sp. 4G57]|uniref:Low temperature requirement protein A n=1 Tax=Micromonospora sicca TaxID=2202420 RepID=A0ABU5JBT7_9ACTN|nr:MULTISPECIES: low temperature requirement protein A [unclassified Micromonospora]MDZ5445639.1 low temperature requirement protein A [Micromonospora sp. 4G57]MDZ5490057.1 low temperature requirement protein A [Micromonospora sp. 4G53]